MEILLLHQHFRLPSEGGGIRSYHVARALASAGHRVCVFSGNRHGSVEPIHENVVLKGLNVPYNNHFLFARRIFAFLHFCTKAYWDSRKLNRIDLVYAISTPLTVGWVGKLLNKKFRAKFIFEVGDLWPEAPIQIGAIQNPILIKWLFLLEKKIYQSADCTIALSPDIAKYIAATCPTARVETITNMSDNDFFGQCRNHNQTKKLTIGYFGAFGIANHLEYLVAAAAEAQQQALAIDFILMGEGRRLTMITEEIASRGLNNIKLYPWGGKDALIDKTKACDAMFVSFKNLPVLAKGSPNKFFDGLAAGKIIIVNFGGWLADVVAQTNIGFGYDPEDAKEFCTKIQPYINDLALREATQKRAAQLGREKFDLKLLTQKIVDVVDSLNG